MKNMTYQEKKEQARQEAVNFQRGMSAEKWDYTLKNGYSYYELVEFQNYFTNLGKKYGLLKEFKENGII